MKLLTFADLHIGDYRNTSRVDGGNLECLQRLTDKIKPDLVLNIGDTVSKDAYLRHVDEKMKYWQQYLAFKERLDCPVLETCLARERDYFKELFQLDGDYSVEQQGIGFISFSPLEENDHEMIPTQMEWLTAEIKRMAGKKLVLMSHVPIAQTTVTRPVEKGMYLNQSDLIADAVAEYSASAIFLGGHFHVSPEQPRQQGRGIMLMAGCHSYFSSDNHYTYFRVIDISEQCTSVCTINDSMQDILPAFSTTI